MPRDRLAAFSDGVIAILITIMVLGLRIPRGVTLEALRPVLPQFLSYIVSFVFLGIYWSNHHHLLHVVERVNGRILWANLHLLFWLSMIPFATGWVGENHVASGPTALYGVVLLLAAIAYFILVRSIIKAQGPDSRLARILGRDLKSKVSVGLYAAAIPLAFLAPWIADAIYVAVALIWLVPDKRIESGFYGK